MKSAKSSWFVTGVVAGAVIVAAIVLAVNEGSFSPKVAQASVQEDMQHQLACKSLSLLHDINRVCKKVDAMLDPSASSDGKAAVLKADLQTVRGQVELYKFQHLNAWPNGNITAQLTKKTNSAGEVEGASGASGPFSCGPYLQKMPTNPFTGKSSVQTGTGKPGGGNAGWYYNTQTGKFSADSGAHKGL